MNWALSVALPGACSPSPGAFVSYGGCRFRASRCIAMGFRGSRAGATRSRYRSEEDEEDIDKPVPRGILKKMKQRHSAMNDEEFEREPSVSRGRPQKTKQGYSAEDYEDSEDWDDSDVLEEDEEESKPGYDPELQHKFTKHAINRKLSSLRRRLLRRSQAAEGVEGHAKSEERQSPKKPRPKKVREEPVISLEDHVRKLYSETGEELDPIFSKVFDPNTKTQTGDFSSEYESEEQYESDSEGMVDSKYGRKGRYDEDSEAEGWYDEDAEASSDEKIDIYREGRKHGRKEQYGTNTEAMIEERVDKHRRKGRYDEDTEASSEEGIDVSRKSSKHGRKKQYGEDAEAMVEERVHFPRESTKHGRKGRHDEDAEPRIEEKPDFSRDASRHGKEREYGEDLKKTRKSQKYKDDEEVRLEDAFYSRKSFRKIGASDEIIWALSAMQIFRPSEIQAIAYKNVHRGNDCIIADQTGSGKTLAYLAPLVQYLREEEQKGESSTPRNPRVIILVPTTELASQVLSVCRAISKVCPFKSMVATGGFKWKTQVESLESGPDVVVVTPGRFLQHLEEGTIELNKLLSVVLDEVDILFEEEDFTGTVSRIRKRAPANVQYIHVTATLPTDVFDKIINNHPLSVPCMGPGLHITTAGLREILVDCSGEQDDERTPESAFANKKAELLKILEQSVPKTMIFCNKIESCRKVENVLKRYDRDGSDLKVLAYHSALTQEARLANLKEFQKDDSEVSKFLVCTDRASRGLDATGVERVILFDFPREPSEYIRRVGRTARAGGSGKVFVFVVGKQVRLAKKVMSSNEKRQPVHAVPGANYL